MPTYGYQCTSCENSFEVVQKITDDPLVTCSVCGGELRKKIFPVGIQFKGSGFYVNDYAAGGKKENAGSAPATDSAPVSTGEVKSETGEAATPAPATELKPAAPAAPSVATPAGGTATS